MKRRRTNAQAISQLMRERIQSAEWMPGQLISGRRALASECHAALTTVERSAATLIAEGLLRVDGRRPAVVPSDVSNDPDDQTRSAMATSMAFLSEGMQPGTGIIAPNDAIAAAFIRVAAHADLQAGRDFAIIGFDDRERALGLTSMRPQLEAIGEEAGRLALRLLSGETCPPRVVIPHRLIPRISTRSPLSESDAESVGVTSQGALQ
jgi:DNA-binding LacI/PurR family transcriptional regulator